MKHKSADSEVASTIHAIPEPAPVGYPGQFYGLSLDEQTGHSEFIYILFIVRR